MSIIGRIKMSDDVIDYMVNKKWEEDNLKDKKLKILALIKNIDSNSDVVSKLGVAILCIQFEELLLKEAINISKKYIQAEIWPARVDLSDDLDEKTFGSLITYFKNNSIKISNKKELIDLLNVQKNLRNEIVHKIFRTTDIKSLEKLVNKAIIAFPDVAQKILDYHDYVCSYLNDLSKRVNFSEFDEGN